MDNKNFFIFLLLLRYLWIKYYFRSSSPGAGSLEMPGSTPRSSTNYYNTAAETGFGHAKVGKTRSVSSLTTATTAAISLQSSPPRPGGSKEPSLSSRKTSKTSLDNADSLSGDWRHNNEGARLSDNSHEESQFCQERFLYFEH